LKYGTGPKGERSRDGGGNLSDAIASGYSNVINPHTHGLHGSPAGNSDNPLLERHPVQKFHCEITLPRDHPAGT